VVETNILLPLSPKLQDGISKSFFTIGASSLGIVISAKKPILFYFDLIVPKPKKARRVEWELSKMFYDIWIAKLPWVKLVMGLNGKLSIIKCRVCSYVEKKDKLFVFKFDGLHKHVRQRKVIVAHFNVKV